MTFSIRTIGYYIDRKLAKHPVLVHLDGTNRCLRITIDGKAHPKLLKLKDLHPDEMDLQDYLKVLQEEAMSIAYYRHSRWMQSADAA